MSYIQISDLSFTHAGSCTPVFDRVSCRLDTGWRLGLVGRNGRGKTTLLKLLAGIYPAGGAVSASVAFTYFPGPAPKPGLEGWEAACGANPMLELWALTRELSLLGADDGILYRPFSTLSGGEQTKLLLAATFLRENCFFLLDEPTNHLDDAGREAVSRYLQRKNGFILVSHDRALLDACTDHTMSINKTNIEIQQGNFSAWYADKQLRDQWELAENARLQKDIRRLNESARRAAAWSDKTERGKHAKNAGLKPDRGYVGHKSAKMMQRAKSIESRKTAMAKEKAGLLKNIETTEALKLSPLIHHAKTLLAAEDVSVLYGGKPVCAPVSFTLSPGERLLLSGKNGAGKTSLLRRLLGEPLAHTGRVTLAAGLAVSYIPQDASFLRGGLRDFCRESGLDESLFFAILRKLDFSRAEFDHDLSGLSAGQQKKVLLARSLCQRAHVYIWDEPLNYIDIFSRMQIEDLLLAAQPAMLFVEHDRTFAAKIATGEVAFSR